MFRGTHRHSLDSKGRLSVPARFRDHLNALGAGQIVLTIDPYSSEQERCLWSYPLPRWEVVEAQVAALDTTNPEVRRFQRRFVGHSEELHLDAQSRILISAELRQFAQLGKDVVLVGQVHRFEIWDAARWDALQGPWMDEGTGLSTALAGLSL